MDADGTHDPTKINKMINIIKNKKIDIINTNRFKDISSMEDWPLTRKVITYLRYYLVELF